MLKSWAVTRGPSLVPGEKRLAVHVEDHPLDYGDFEGTIPKGQYGGGTVIVWDRGTLGARGRSRSKGYAKGHLDFDAGGREAQGPLAPGPHGAASRGEKRENWLLIKGDDEAARAEDDPDILEEAPDSVKTGRAIEEVADEAPGWSSKTGRSKPTKPSRAEGRAGEGARGRLPRLRPARARDAAAAAAARGDDWLHEIKFDGYRLQAQLAGGKVKLLTRSGLDWTDRFGDGDPPSALAALPAQDRDPRRRAGRRERQRRLRLLGAAGRPVGRPQRPLPSTTPSTCSISTAHDLRALPLVARKDALAALLDAAPPSRCASASISTRTAR